MFVALRIAIDAGRGGDHLKTLDGPSSDEMSGRDVCFCVLNVATG
jgi:hypothetical protein